MESQIHEDVRSIVTIVLLADRGDYEQQIADLLNQTEYEHYKLIKLPAIDIQEQLVATDKIDIILLTIDKIDELDNVRKMVPYAPIICLQNDESELNSGKLYRKGVNDIIAMSKITARGLVRALNNNIEQYKTFNQLRKQSMVLNNLLGSISDKDKQVLQSEQSSPKKQLIEELLDTNQYLIDKVKQQSNDLKQLARRDSLTGLANRLEVEELSAAMIASAKRHHNIISLLLIDLDKFKYINDVHGHTAGDELLKAVADRFHTMLRADDVVARIGGDEFAVILNNIRDNHDAGIVAQKLIRALKIPFQLPEHKITVQIDVSIGIATYPDSGENLEELINSADLAMYKAKQSDGQKYQYAIVEQHQIHMRRTKIEDALKQALPRHEFQLVYQPIYSLPDQKIYGMEALLRWDSHSVGHISPSDFIPIAEEAGLINEIGEWIVEEACKQAVTWRIKGHNIKKIAINLSPLQLQQSHLPVVIKTLLDKAELPADLFEFEITEMAIMKDQQTAKKVLQRLNDMGTSHAIGDYGEAHASLSQIKALPINTLKIDRSFVQGIDKSSNDNTIVKTIIDLATQLDLRVIAEGVETKGQLQYLIDNHCKYAQGHYFSKPMKKEKVLDFLNKNR